MLFRRSLPICVVMTSMAAHAGPMRSMVDARTLDANCRALVEAPADARTLEPAIAADLSAASCLAEARMRALTLGPSQASVDALNEAIRPSLALLEAVASTGDPRAEILAAHAKGALYSGVAVRFMAVAPSLPRPVTEGGQAEHHKVVAELDRLARPWRDRAAAAFADVERLGAAAPARVQDDPVVAVAVADRPAERVPGVARK